ncbi:hypothetical protein [Eleftheria terrae]|uniref:hypothetical protein n=1 Tax=Eleftheria terrae TaxID=1597781 RepID=UPI00263AF91A|nr:hypothetical protein [Eleftheria terrae]WKB50525.1 hypothetical protein N7L95_00315 [Eleftheria terrae]
MSQKCVLFDTGFVTRTPGALIAIISAGMSESFLIQRHQSGDFGDIDAEQKAQNAQAVAFGGSVTSCYQLGPRTWVEVITDEDRRNTTVQLPDEH